MDLNRIRDARRSLDSLKTSIIRGRVVPDLMDDDYRGVWAALASRDINRVIALLDEMEISALNAPCEDRQET